MKIRGLLSLLIMLVVPASVFATAQAPDRIIYKGKEYALHTNPMEAYFEKNPAKKPKSNIISSGNWRGYIATFEIERDQLFLKDIHIETAKNQPDGSSEFIEKSVISQIIPKGKKLKIDWFSGLLVLPHGKLVNYVHMGYGSTFENYILIEIDKGDFQKAKEFGYKDYEKFKERQYEAFKKTEEYKKLVEDMKKEGNDQKFIDSFLKNFITNYTSRILVD